MMLWFLLVAILSVFRATAGSAQDDIDYLGSNMEVGYNVLNNLLPLPNGSAPVFLSEITLTNKGSRPITHGDWSVYFCNIRLVEPEHLKHNPAGYVIPGNYGIRFTHINGCLHKFQTTSDFKDIPAGGSFKFEFKAAHWSVSRTDVMPRWYISAEGLNAKVIKNTDDEELKFVGKFDTEKKWKRFAKDVYNPYTPAKRYSEDFVSDLESAPYDVIPTPVEINVDKSSGVTITSEWKVYIEAGLENEAAPLKDKLKLTVSTSTPRDTKAIKLIKGDVSVPAKGGQQFPSSDEWYSLVVDSSKELITITGKGAAGVFYGVQTLLALRNSKGRVPKVTVKDAPRYSYRGMHLDVGRNFEAKEHVFKLLDVMAMYKLNKFHFHLTDDEGWRLKIPGLPELTEVGSKRCFDLEHKKCILSQLGSGPEASTSGSGHYSVQDYKDILKYANARHIQVIPEFDMPGHGNAAIKAMLARYEKLSAQGNKAEAEKYLLSEINDTSKYLSIQYYTDDAINPCIESTYTFIEHLVQAIMDMHKDIQPLAIYHFGGDEVAHGAWTNSTACNNLAQKLGLNSSNGKIVDELKDYFVQRVSNITANHSLQLAGWEDGLMSFKDVPYDREVLRNTRVYGYAWNNIWEWGSGKRAYELANAGYQVIMSQATHLYFDHPYEPDPEERGFYWATRFTNTRKVFGFMPDDLFANVETNLKGEPLTREELCKNPGMCTDLKKKENIVGMQGHLWSETVRTADQMNAMIFPRMIALAERAWHKASWEDISDKTDRDAKRTDDWVKFANTLGYRELGRLDEMGVAYHLTPPGALVDEGKLKITNVFPGLGFQYSTDLKTWKNVEDVSDLEGKINLRSSSADGLRHSRPVKVEAPSKPPSPSSSQEVTSQFVILATVVAALLFLVWE
ncbi:hypothetical protein ACROYT_G031679 [Oculina patagonica]